MFKNKKFDAIVAGSGPGGATVSRELSSKGKKVLILEWGPNPTLKNTFYQYALYQLMPGKSLLITNNMLGMVRGIITGGSSIFYYGTCFPVPFEMLESHGINIRDEVASLKKELPMGPLKDEMVGPKARLIMDSARKLGHDWNKLDKFMFQEKWRPGMAFGYYGDPHDVKWSARMFVRDAVNNGATILNNAKVKKVIIEGGKATGVEFSMNGKKVRAFADNIIIAAGGIGSSVILKNSGFVGVGLDYFFDPLISVVGYVDGMENSKEIPMSCGAHFSRDGYMMTDMGLPNMLNFIFSSQVLRFHRMFSNKKAVRIMIKARDTLGGRITRGGGVRKKLSDVDRDKLLHGYGRAKEILANAGAKGIFKTWYLAAHPGGTVKLGQFIDSNFKTEYDNLYVCDCSIIPEPWGLPPTLTILGMAKKLAGHLCGVTSAAAEKSASST